VAHVEKSPFTLFVEALRQVSYVKAARIPLHLGADKTPETSAPRRVVFVPVTGSFAFPQVARRTNTAAPPLADSDERIAAKIWAASLDDAWDIRRRLLQAIHNRTANGGYAYKLDGESTQWLPSEDTNTQGESCTVFFVLTLPIERVDETTAEAETVEQETALVNPDTAVEEAGPTITITE
jgi:hypothetical protein